jgi:outer membrane protein assembly factor BamA
MRPSVIPQIIFLFCISLLAIPLSAQTSKLAQVKVTGSVKFPEAQIAAASGLTMGATVSKDDIQAAANRLADLGPFTNVRYRFSSVGDTVSVEFTLADAPTVPVLFDNFTLFSDEELTQALKDSVGLFDGTAPEQGFILDSLTEALQQFLAKHGIKAAVERTYLAGPGESGMIQRFEIKGVAGLKVSAVQFGDALAAESRKLAEPARDLIGKPFSRFAVGVFAGEHVRPLYLARGNLRVQFGTPQARFTGNPNQPLPDNVIVFLPITPGPTYRWGGATWSGNSVFIPQALVDFLGFGPDEVADGLKVEAGWERVRKEYGKHGYLDAAIDAEPVLDSRGLGTAARVHYRARVTEGVQYRMGQLVITGLSLTAERLLIAAWRIPAGEVFDKSSFEDFLANQVKNKKLFGEHVVHFQRVGDLLQTNLQKQSVDVLLDFH